MNQINWKVRLKNKTFLITFITTILSFIYTMLGMFGVVPSVAQSTIGDLVLAVINVLVAVGIVVDPTTAGISDSEQALTYETVKGDK